MGKYTQTLQATHTSTNKSQHKTKIQIYKESYILCNQCYKDMYPDVTTIVCGIFTCCKKCCCCNTVVNINVITPHLLFVVLVQCHVVVTLLNKCE